MIEYGLEICRDMIIPLIIAFCVTALFTWKLIPALKKVDTTQTILDDAPERHQEKSGTPTMGGLAIIFGLLVGSAVSMILNGFSSNLTVVLILVLVFGGVGFLDDYTKVAKKRNLGLRAREKLALQIFFSLAFAIYYVFVAKMGTQIIIPFIWKSVNIGYWIIPYIIFIMVAMVNAVNLTDGLDGLAAGVSTAISLFFPLITILGSGLGYEIFVHASGSGVQFVLLDSMRDSIFFAALAGACMGFLVFNRYPAKIFMGDTGSLAIGGGIAAAAIITHMELMLPILGLVFVVEALSDIIQVGSYKYRNGKRVFKMAPIHHHFELSGWHEKKVVFVFVTFTAVLCVISIVIMFIQVGNVN